MYGTTTWRTNGTGWMLGGEITLATHVSDGRPLDRMSARMIALHEIGHLIGLSHSADPGDIMAALVRVEMPTLADVATARLLYAFPAGRVRS